METEFSLSQAVASGDAFEHRPSERGHCVQDFSAELDLRDLPGEAVEFEFGADDALPTAHLRFYSGSPHQSPPPLHQPGAIMQQRAAAGNQKPANGQLGLNYLSHPRGQAQRDASGLEVDPNYLGKSPLRSGDDGSFLRAFRPRYGAAGGVAFVA